MSKTTALLSLKMKLIISSGRMLPFLSLLEGRKTED
jgi:hypothetical protein